MKTYNITEKELDGFAKNVASLSRESHEASVSKFMMQNKLEHEAIDKTLNTLNDTIDKIDTRLKKTEEKSTEALTKATFSQNFIHGAAKIVLGGALLSVLALIFK
jgi:uncharacterized protein (DUF342 family)